MKAITKHILALVALFAFAPAAMAEDTGVKLSKTVADKGDGNYSLTLESFATGHEITSSVTVYKPMDVVLVLDVSGSMRDKLDGSTKLQILKDAATAFVDSLASSKYNPKGDNTLTIIKYANYATLVSAKSQISSNLSSVKNSIKNEISLPTENPTYDSFSGDNVYDPVTRMDFGMGIAYREVKTWPTKNSERNQMILLMTDGYPQTQSYFTGSSNGDFKYQPGFATIYFSQLCKKYCDVYCLGIKTSSKSDLQSTLLKYISSNCPNATVERQDGNQNYKTQTGYSYYWNKLPILNGALDWNKTSSAKYTVCSDTDYPAWHDIHVWNRSDSKGYFKKFGKNYPFQDVAMYFVSATNFDPVLNTEETKSGFFEIVDSKNGVMNYFKGLTKKVVSGGSTIELGASSVVKDYITSDFMLPEGITASDIKVTKAKVKTISGSTYTWNAEESVSGVTVTPDRTNNMVSVTGFDFTSDANWVGSHSGTITGYKLIVRIPIQMADSYTGGKDRPTNKETSGLYKDASATQPVDKYPVPVADLPVPVTIETIGLEAGDNAIYNVVFNKERTGTGVHFKGPYSTTVIATGKGSAESQKVSQTLMLYPGQYTITSDNSWTKSYTLTVNADGTYDIAEAKTLKYVFKQTSAPDPNPVPEDAAVNSFTKTTSRKTVK